MRGILAYLAFMISFVVIGSAVASWRGDSCADGWESSSIGERGACSHHGGVARASQWAFLASLLIPVAIGIFVYAKSGDGRVRKKVKRPWPPPSPKPKKNSPVCVACGSRMQKRRARVGRNAGKLFWGCSKYPTCNNTLPYQPETA